MEAEGSGGRTVPSGIHFQQQSRDLLPEIAVGDSGKFPTN